MIVTIAPKAVFATHFSRDNPPNSAFLIDFGGLSEENNPPNSAFFIDFGGLLEENIPPNSAFFIDFGGLSGASAYRFLMLKTR